MSRSIRRSKAIRANIQRTPIVLLFLCVAAVIAADRFLELGLNGFDYAALIVIALFALKGYLQGLVNTVFSLLGYIGGAIGAILLSPAAAGWAMQHTGLGKALGERLSKMLPLLSAVPVPAPDTTEKLTTPASWIGSTPAAQKALEGQPLLMQVLGTANPVVGEGGAFAAPVANLNDWLVWSLLRILAVFVLFLGIKLLLVLAGKLITALMTLSTVLGTANRTGGMAVGLLVGLIILYVLVGAVIPFLGSLHILSVPDAFAESKCLFWFNQLVALRGKLG